MTHPHLRAALPVIVLSTALGLACSGGDKAEGAEQKPADASPSAETQPATAPGQDPGEATPEQDPGEATTNEVAPSEDEEPSEEPGDPDSGSEAEVDLDAEAEALGLDRLEDPPEIPVLTPKPAPAKLSWREVLRPKEAVELINLASGVLAKGAGGYYDVDEGGQLVLRAEIEAPGAAIIGHWPKSAWFIETREELNDRSDPELGSHESVRLMRLRGKRRWVPQAFDGEQRWERGSEMIRLGGKGGLLIIDGSTGDNGAGFGFEPLAYRIADTAAKAGFYTYAGPLVDFLESASGRIYGISNYEGKLVVHRECEEPECVGLNLWKFPGTDWSFAHPRTRRRHSVSAVATTGGKHHLLHYEFEGKVGGWKLEALPKAVTGLWPTKSGALWVQLGDELWRRDNDGKWTKAELPAGLSGLSVAIRGDQSEIWIAGEVGGKPVVFATAAEP